MSVLWAIAWAAVLVGLAMPVLAVGYLLAGYYRRPLLEEVGA